MSNEEKSKNVNPYDLNSVKKERVVTVKNPSPRDVNPYSLSGRNKVRMGNIKKF